jgi:hypothetical protein
MTTCVIGVFSCYAHCKLIFRLLILPGITQWRSEPSSILLVAAAMIGLRYTYHGLINSIDTKAKCRHLKKLTCEGTLW